MVRADRVLAAPLLVGPRIAGVPANFVGFVETRALGRVDGLDDVAGTPALSSDSAVRQDAAVQRWSAENVTFGAPETIRAVRR